MKVIADGVGLFVNGRVILEGGSGAFRSNPAHDHRIVAVAHSPNEQFVLSVDETGRAKIWKPNLEMFSQRLWASNLPIPVVAPVCAIHDSGRMIALIVSGDVVAVYAIPMPYGAAELRAAIKVPARPIRELHFGSNDDSVTCVDHNGSTAKLSYLLNWTAATK